MSFTKFVFRKFSEKLILVERQILAETLRKIFGRRACYFDFRGLVQKSRLDLLCLPLSVTSTCVIPKAVPGIICKIAYLSFEDYFNLCTPATLDIDNNCVFLAVQT